MSYEGLETSRTQRTLTGSARLLLALHIDGPLFIALSLVGAVGVIVLFSASGQNLRVLEAQLIRFGLATVAMMMLAQIPPRLIRATTPWAYCLGLLLLIAVMLTGDVAMGAQRWLDLGVVRFQPSEMMKLAVPLACAWYLHERALPPSLTSLLLLAAGYWRTYVADRRTTRPRHRAARRRRRRHGGSARGAATALHTRRRGTVRTRCVRRVAVPAARLPEAAGAHVPRSAERPARFGLSHHSVADRDRIGRRIRQGVFQRQSGATGVSAGTLDRFYFRGDRRGVGADRTCHRHPAVHVRDRPLALSRRDGAGHFRAAGRRKPEPHVLRIRVRQHRHGDRIASRRRRAVAAHQLRRALQW